MRHTPCCPMAPVAAADRSIRTPTSSLHPSTTHDRQHTEEDRLVGIPRQQPVHQPATRPYDLARQTHKGIDKRLEFQTQHPLACRPSACPPSGQVVLASSAPTTPSSSRPASSSPCTPSCSPGCPKAPSGSIRR